MVLTVQLYSPPVQLRRENEVSIRGKVCCCFSENYLVSDYMAATLVAHIPPAVFQHRTDCREMKNAVFR